MMIFPPQHGLVMEGLSDQALVQVAQYFAALAEPTRLRILNCLRQQPHHVGELAELTAALEKRFGFDPHEFRTWVLLHELTHRALATGKFDDARLAARIAAFIGGQPDEVVFTRGATEAINLVAYSYPDKGRVLLSVLEHHSNIVPWQLAGWQVDVCPLTSDGRIDLDAAEAMLTPEHKIVAFAHVSNVLGSVLDARRAVVDAVGIAGVTKGEAHPPVEQ